MKHTKYKSIQRHRFFPMVFLAIGLAVSVLAGSANGAEQEHLFRIVQLSDSQPTNEDQWRGMAETIELVNRLKPDIVLFAGDITHSGTEEEYKRAHSLLSKIKAPLHVVPGNHDTIWRGTGPHSQKIPLYRKFFGNEFWSAEQGDFLFVGFDCTESWPHFTPERLAWLKSTLLGSAKRYKFFVTHYPNRDFVEDSPKLNQMLISSGVVGLMHGHNHSKQAYRDEKTGRLVFSSGSILDRGVMYFDVYEQKMNCFWQSVGGGVPSPWAVLI